MKCKISLMRSFFVLTIFVFPLLVVGVDVEVFLKQGIFLGSQILQRAHLNHRLPSTWQVGML